MNEPLLEFLFSDYRRKVLNLLLNSPQQAFHVREIARQTATQAGTLHKELSKLAQVGILQKQEQGKQLYYRVNVDCLIYPELAAIFRKTSGLAVHLRFALAVFESRIILAFVFGSVASGKATDASDVDLLIVGDVTFNEIVMALYPLQAELGREINPKVYSVAEWLAALDEKTAFIQDVLSKPRLWIAGDKDDAEQFSRDRVGGNPN